MPRRSNCARANCSPSASSASARSPRTWMSLPCRAKTLSNWLGSERNSKELLFNPPLRGHDATRMTHGDSNSVHRCRGLSRRSFLADTGMGFTGLALGALLFEEGVARALGSETVAPWRPPDGRPHFSPRAKSVIWIFLCGGVSHVESFDLKPELNKYAGKSIEETPFKNVLATEGKDIVDGNPKHGNRKMIMPLQTGFKAYGQCGLVVGDWFAHVGACADDLAVVRSLWTIHNDHGAQLTWQTGRHPRELEHPTLGAWVSYGLGSVNENLPEYVVLGVPTGDCCGGTFTHCAAHLGSGGGGA